MLSVLEIVPPVTLTPPVAVRFAPESMLKLPLLEVTAPATLPWPLQSPPVTPRVLPMLPVEPRLIVPPFKVVAPVTVPVPLRVAPEPIAMVPSTSPFTARFELLLKVVVPAPVATIALEAMVFVPVPLTVRPLVVNVAVPPVL